MNGKSKWSFVKYFAAQYKGVFFSLTLGVVLFVVVLTMVVLGYSQKLFTLFLSLLAILVILLGIIWYFVYESRLYGTIRRSLNVYIETGMLEPIKHFGLNMMEEYVLSKAKAEVAQEYSELIYNKQMEMEVLQGRINPHFLYNTLDSIRGEALLQGASEVADMAEALASIFRYGVSARGNYVTLADELQNIKHYVTLQKFRFGNRFEYQLSVDDDAALKCIVPKLTLQPLVENAISHGLESTKSGGLIIILIQKTDQNLIINVTDNGVGMNEETLIRLQSSLRCGLQSRYDDYIEKNGTGIALHNINDRIKISFGAQYGINVYSVFRAGTNIEITLPICFEAP